MTDQPRTDPGPAPRRRRRVALWVLLVALLAVAQSLLVWLTIRYENTRAQDQVDATAAAVAAEVKQTFARRQQDVQALLWNDPAVQAWREAATTLVRERRELARLERRGPAHAIEAVVDSPYRGPLFSRIARADLDIETELACATATRLSTPAYSRSYFVPQPDGLGAEVIDLCIAVLRQGRSDGFVVATFPLTRLLEQGAGDEIARRHELSFVEADGTRLARAGLTRGAGVYVAERLVDLPAQTLQLRVDSGSGSPGLIPNVAVALVLGLSLALGAVVLLLARDVRRRAVAEGALAEALAFRKAMEDSLVTGLRARDLQGRITYVNPAFCQMVGMPASELVGTAVPPYWPPELAEDYARRQALRLGTGTDGRDGREGFETLFMRKNGERFPVLIFEAPLIGAVGRQSGWMSAVLDISAQRRVEELSRQQQERLQATARLATVGEMASLLSHELNQPLAAIASYAAGTQNLLAEERLDDETLPMLRQAAQRIAEQAERAGRVIKSVHAFVRRREQSREAVRADVLVDAVLPLVRLQARKSGTQVEIEIADPPPRVVCDRTMVEQVLLNLTRNAIQAMENVPDPAQRVLTLRVQPQHARWVAFSIVDRGPGIAPEVAQRLFTPFFTTRSEGMGLGLSLCRTVVEQHGGALDFQNLAVGTEFRFTLPAETPRTPSP